MIFHNVRYLSRRHNSGYLISVIIGSKKMYVKKFDKMRQYFVIILFLNSMNTYSINI